jgi:hypothetical protein
MTTSLAQEAYTLNSLDSTTMEKFFEQLNELRKRNFAPLEFGDMVKRANSTSASLAEMNQAYNQIANYAGERAENWIPMKENFNAYAKAGFENMSHAEMKGAKSNQSVWSVINGLTHFATHANQILDTNLQESDATRMMVNAGNIFGKGNYDHANQMPDIFGKNALTDHVQVGAILS